MSTAARYLTALMFVLTLSSAPAWAEDEHNRLVFFGDSLSDPGNYYLAFGQVSQAPFAPIPDAPYDIGGGHHYTDGRTWAEQLAAQLDTPFSGRPGAGQPGGVHQLRGRSGPCARERTGLLGLRPQLPGGSVPHRLSRPRPGGRDLCHLDRCQRSG